MSSSSDPDEIPIDPILLGISPSGPSTKRLDQVESSGDEDSEGDEYVEDEDALRDIADVEEEEAEAGPPRRNEDDVLFK